MVTLTNATDALRSFNRSEVQKRQEKMHMKLSESIVALNEKHAEMVKQLSEILTKNGDVDVYIGNMIPFDCDHLDEQLHVDMVTPAEVCEPEEYPNGYLHLGAW